MKRFSSAIFACLIASQAQSQDIPDVAEKWMQDLLEITNILIHEAHRLEDVTGEMPLPDGFDLALDDPLGDHTVAIAKRMGVSYSAMIDSLSDVRDDIDPGEMKEAMSRALLGAPGRSDRDLADIATDMEDLLDEFTWGDVNVEYDPDTADLLRSISDDLRMQAEALDER